MDEIYYQPNHLWKGQKAVKKLKEYSKEKPKTVKQWLSWQAFWQVHLPAPKHIDRPHHQVIIPNEMIADIYKVSPLTYPKTFQCDNDTEFKGEVPKMLEKQEVKIRRVTTKYKHTHTAFVEAMNKILAERLFKVQDAQQLNDPVQVSSRWVKHLYGLVDVLNNTETEMTGMKPKDAIVLDQVPLVNREAYPPEEVLPEDGLYRYLLQPGEEHDDKRCRATDRIWSKGTYRLRKVMENPVNHVMYYLLGPGGAPTTEMDPNKLLYQKS